MASSYEFEDTIIKLIKKHRTKLDEKVLEKEKERKKFKYWSENPDENPIVHRSRMTAKKEFTDDFLALIDSETHPETHTNPLSNSALFTMITYKMIEHAGLYANYAVADRLYFLFLANVYCNSLFYLEKYPWLPQLLSVFEQTGLTGEFNLTREQYREFFAKCHEHKQIKTDLDFAIVYDPLDNTHKPTPNLKTLSNTTLENAFKSDIPATGSFLLPQCIYGSECYRHDPVHLSKYAHPSVAGPSAAGPSAAGPSVAPSRKRKHESREPHESHSKKHGGTKRRGTKRRGTKRRGTKRRDTKRRGYKKTRKHYIKRK